MGGLRDYLPGLTLNPDPSPISTPQEERITSVNHIELAKTKFLIPTLGRPGQEDHEFKASLGYIARPRLKKKKFFLKS
jgi:hypothetical protein